MRKFGTSYKYINQLKINRALPCWAIAFKHYAFHKTCKKVCDINLIKDRLTGNYLIIGLITFLRKSPVNGSLLELFAGS